MLNKKMPNKKELTKAEQEYVFRLDVKANIAEKNRNYDLANELRRERMRVIYFGL